MLMETVNGQTLRYSRHAVCQYFGQDCNYVAHYKKCKKSKSNCASVAHKRGKKDG